MIWGGAGGATCPEPKGGPRFESQRKIKQTSVKMWCLKEPICKLQRF